MLKDPLKVLNWSIFFQTQILMLPVMLLFYQANGLTKGDYFLFQGIFSIAALLFEIPAGYIADWFSRKKMLILSYLLFIARLLLWFFFGGYWIVLVGELLYAASKAFLSGVADGYIYDLLKSKGKANGMLKRYGRFNFYMSLGTAFASIAGSLLYEEFGILTVIFIELIMNSIALSMLYFLPNVPSFRTVQMTFKEKYIDLFRITTNVFTNVKIKYYVFYSAIAVASTMIFVWSFQPLMQAALIPVGLFGVVYFFNHAFRALASFFLQTTMRYFTLRSLGVLLYASIILCYFIAEMMLKIQSVYINFALIIFICFVIGIQLTFTLSSVSRIHTLVTSDIRSTVISVNTMMSRLATGIVLILFKFLLDGMDMGQAFYVYMGRFIFFGTYPLYKLVKMPESISRKDI